MMEPYGQAGSPKTVPTNANLLRQGYVGQEASVGHPPMSEIRRSIVDPLLTEFAFTVTHSSTAKAVPAPRSAMFGFPSRQEFRHAGVVSCVGG